MNPKRVIEEFEAGMQSGRHPNPENDAKAARAVQCDINKLYCPLIVAYWGGYLFERGIF